MIGMGHKGVLVTLNGRKSKLRLALPAAKKTTETVTSSIVTLLDKVKALAHTINFDS